METVFRNPYQNVLETTVREQWVEGKTRYMRTEDTILPPYRKLHLAPESICLDDAVSVTLTEQGDLAVPVSYDNNRPVLSVPFEGRLSLLKNVTARLLLYAIAQTYLARIPQFRAVDRRADRFAMTLTGAFLPHDAEAIGTLLLRRVVQWERAGLNLQSDAHKRETTIFGMTTLPWMGPHLFHTAECGVLTLESREVQAGALQFQFRISDRSRSTLSL